MFKDFVKILFHLMVVVFLTVTTQIGGIIYLVSILTLKSKISNYRIKRLGIFVVMYLLSNLAIIPNLAPVFGREKITESEHLVAHTFLTNLMNRNYVQPELNASLQLIAKGLNEKHIGIQLTYLDANFPFINKFPLLPHLSHNDGKKIDLSFIYTDEGKLSNKKPAVSGYGFFEAPKTAEYNQIQICLDKGGWQYDFTKYFTFGTINSDLTFSEKATKDLILEILKQPSTGKLFIEPHLKTRLNLKNQKIRFHGCQAVRHDDHIHFQLK